MRNKRSVVAAIGLAIGALGASMAGDFDKESAEAVRLQQQGKVDEAIAAYRQIADVGGGTDEGHAAALQVPALYAATGRTQEAIAEYQRYLEKFPASGRKGAALLGLAQIYVTAGNLREAERVYASLPVEVPLDWDAPNRVRGLLGVAYLRGTNLVDRRKGAAMVLETLSARPIYWGAHSCLAPARDAGIESVAIPLQWRTMLESLVEDGRRTPILDGDVITVINEAACALAEARLKEGARQKAADLYASAMRSAFYPKHVVVPYTRLTDEKLVALLDRGTWTVALSNGVACLQARIRAQPGEAGGHQIWIERLQKTLSDVQAVTGK
jgi:tetratricopeptide (TPR) repeat protein